ncbi:MAG: metallophosphoesterase, partial [Chitinispirillaceae bacterium]|nr:metallophosphoesterase [Chitinispirillaceae bacterium]
MLLVSWSVSVQADFTIGVNGDTQVLSESTTGAANLKAMNQFYIDSSAKMKIKFVISVGDMTQNQNNSTEWSRVKAAYAVLDAAGMPYAPCKGNHDALSGINSTFPVSTMSKKPYWGGSMSNSIENAYYKFSAEGMDFIIVVVAEPYSTATRAWARQIFAANPTRRGILACHNTNPGDGQSNEMKASKNLFLTVMGHDCINNGERNYEVTSTAGSKQYYCMTDYQCRSNGGAFVRLYTFKTAENKFCATTYNITAKAYEIDANSTFCLAYPMSPVTAVQKSVPDASSSRRVSPMTTSG